MPGHYRVHAAACSLFVYATISMGQNNLSNRFLFYFFRSTRRRQILDIFCGSFRHFLRLSDSSETPAEGFGFFFGVIFQKSFVFFGAEKKKFRNRHKRHFFRFGRKKNSEIFLFNGEMTAGDLPESNFISKRIGTAPTASKLNC